MCVRPYNDVGKYMLFNFRDMCPVMLNVFPTSVNGNVLFCFFDEIDTNRLSQNLKRTSLYQNSFV